MVTYNEEIMETLRLTPPLIKQSISTSYSRKGSWQRHVRGIYLSAEYGGVTGLKCYKAKDRTI